MRWCREKSPKQSRQPTNDKYVREVRRSDRLKAVQHSQLTPMATVSPKMIEVKSDSAITKYHRTPYDMYAVMSSVTLGL